MVYGHARMHVNGYNTDLKALGTPSLARGSLDTVAISAGGFQSVAELGTRFTVIGRHVHKHESTVAVPCGGTDARFPRRFVTRSKPTRRRSARRRSRRA